VTVCVGGLGRKSSTMRLVPVPGYSGFIPGVASGNKHGATYGAILAKDEIRNPGNGRQRQSSPGSPGGESPHGRATAIGLIREGEPVDVPVVGYMGFIPGWTVTCFLWLNSLVHHAAVCILNL
jgi:hypothetical protein